MERIIEYYREKGFFDARIIERKGEYEQNRKKVNFTFVIYEGERSKIGDITISGNNELESNDILKILDIKIGEWFDGFKIRKGAFFLTRKYSTIGYIDMNLNYEIEREGNLVYLKIKIDEGNKFYIRNVSFKGNTSVRNRIIEREIRVKRNDIYNSDKIFETQNRLFGTQLFSEIEYEVLKVNEDSLDIIFRLEEMKKKWIGFGFGYESPDKVNIEISWGHNNLFNNLQRIKIESSLAFKFSSNYSFYFKLTYQEPYLLGREVQFEIKPEYRFIKDTSFTQDIRLFNMSFVRFFERNMISLILNLRQAKVDTTGYFIDTTEYRSTNSIVINSLSEGRDNIINPLNGYYLFGSVEKAGGFLGGYNRYYRFHLENAIYKGIYNSTLCMRLKTVFTLPEMDEYDITPDARLELGGWRSIRGYDEASIGIPDIRGKKSGLNILLLNIEFRIRFLSRFYLIFFYDIGNNWISMDDIDFKDIYSGTGIGFGYITQIGTIRIDYGRKLEQWSETYKGKLYISIGHPF